MYDVNLVTAKDDINCGPASLCMLLGYYGTEIPLDDLSQECRARIGGCSASDLLRVGRAHGLDMIAFKMDAAELIRQDRPAIIWWMYNHFVVFCGIDENGRVVIANPGRGRYGLDVESFCTMYSGVALFNGDPVDAPVPTDRVTALEEAVVELADLTASHDDALVELAGLIGG